MTIAIKDLLLTSGRNLAGNIIITKDAVPPDPSPALTSVGEPGFEYKSPSYLNNTAVNKIEITGSGNNIILNSGTLSTPIVSDSITPKLTIKIFGSSDRVEKVVTLKTPYEPAVLYVEDDPEVIAETAQVGDVKTPAKDATFNSVVTKSLGSESFELTPITDYELAGYYETRTVSSVTIEGDNLKVVFSDLIAQGQRITYTLAVDDPIYPLGAPWKDYSEGVSGSSITKIDYIDGNGTNTCLIPLSPTGLKDANFSIKSISFSGGSIYQIGIFNFNITYNYRITDSVVDHIFIEGSTGFGKGEKQNYKIKVYFSKGQGTVGTVISENMFEWLLLSSHLPTTELKNPSLPEDINYKLSKDLFIGADETSAYIRIGANFTQNRDIETTRAVSIIVPMPNIPNFHGTTSGITSYSTFESHEAALREDISGEVETLTNTINTLETTLREDISGSIEIVENEIEDYRVDYRTNIKPLLDKAATELWGPNNDGTGISGLVVQLIKNEEEDDEAFDLLKSDISGYLWDYRKPAGIKEQLDKAVVDVYGENGISGKVFNLEEELDIEWD
jgi:hypothetical protein